MAFRDWKFGSWRYHTVDHNFWFRCGILVGSEVRFEDGVRWRRFWITFGGFRTWYAEAKAPIGKWSLRHYYKSVETK